MKWHQRFISDIFYAFVRLASFLPIGLLYFKASLISFFAEKILRYRYPVIIQNLSRSFPELNYNEIKTLAHQFYVHFFEIFAEVIKTPDFSKKEANARFKVENPEIISQLHEKGINTIALSGHRGNWEWYGLMPLAFNFSTYTLYKPLTNKPVEGVVTRIRQKNGLRLLAMNQAARYILSKKDYPALYIFVGDQSPSHRDPDYSFDFMNQPSLFFTGGAKLAHATRSAVVYISVNKVSRGFYNVKFIPISVPDEGLTEHEILQKYIQLLEHDIQQQPAFWLWSHKRWKHRPAN